ncbi:uncharacterized protein I303_103516 [Kwoniella dejecticola CBS 10117]|uniref:LIM zinc-binding domain-containing protein n=1 Tax=Kwoniella dejecticola CBS 10117 TaxID=1296121 RepID=A0A1A6A6Z4_9TREE|nr:uncharacterized protein I303_03540 [Kwoniella dejecticola CBS 10117]OBR85827.1 hypothetical protein I303_03540 [Kwoniella dejecticola CBS 10117]
MSLFAPRPETERVSVLLPNVTCSSCEASIPLSSLGEHVCSGPSRGLANRNAPRPSQIAIPQARPAAAPPMSRQMSSQSHRGPSPTGVRPPFAGPSSAHPSPTEFTIPRRPSAANLSPHDQPGSYSAYPIPPVKTPSPTNPFFPHPDGSAVNAAEPQSSPMIDTTSGGESGMAGVGRRAFAAAAWGVRAGVALAKQHIEQPLPSPSFQSEHPPWQQSQPASSSHASTREPSLLPKVPLSGRQNTGPSPTFGARPEMHHSHTAPIGSTSSYSPPRSRTPASPPRRSASAASHRSNPSSPPRRKESVSSNTSSRSGQGGESISQLLRARTNTAPTRPSKPGFFDKVKEMQAHERSNTVGPVLGIGMARSASGESSRSNGQSKIHASPQTTTFELEDEDLDDQPSALPWATPALADSPMMSTASQRRSNDTKHHRNPTAGSEASSSSSSSRSGRWGATSGPESEEVVTPSQSLEMLSDRVHTQQARPTHEPGMKSFGSAGGMEGRDILDQIGEEDEEDEGERVVFGKPTARNLKGTTGDRYLPNSHSNSTITSTRPYPPTTAPHSSPNRSKKYLNGNGHGAIEETPKPKSHKSSNSTSSSNSLTSTRRKKVCVKCGDSVGGSKRFVERDGVVLCEKDWKKMYLPSCRRCNLPIEKSAVSSSDGQLKGKWHRECFTCYKCDKPFEGDDFYVYGGKSFCQFHYHEENGTLCASLSCHQPIEGACIVTPGPSPQRFHPGHLRCDHRGGVSEAQNCREAMDEYYEFDGMRYCERHVHEATKGNRMLRAEKRRTRLVDLSFGSSNGF